MGHIGSKSCHTHEEGTDRHSQFREHEGEASTPQHSDVDRRLEKPLEHLIICPVDIVKIAAHGARRGASWRNVVPVVLSKLRVLRLPRALQKVGVHDAVAHRQGSGSAARPGAQLHSRVRGCAACAADLSTMAAMRSLRGDLRPAHAPPPAAEAIQSSTASSAATCITTVLARSDLYQAVGVLLECVPFYYIVYY
eukprot:COSAG02_NODE_4561_length_5215_cov_13.429055_3_plen_195_part_00